MKRILLIIAVGLALLPILRSTAHGKGLSDFGPVLGRDHGLHVDLWTDRSQDAVYAPGEDVGMYLRANDDCYVSIYAITTEGDVELLFPRYPDDGFVFGGATYRLPDYYDDWRYRADGPEGVAYLHAVATRTPRAFRYRPVRDRYAFGISPVVGDPFLAINAINDRIILGTHIHATATVSFFIGRRVWYPRYACYDCHGRGPRFDPYLSECPRYVVRLAHDYDYWWAYDYHPSRVHFVFGGAFWRFETRTGAFRRARHVRYVDCALGYHNYHPMRTISRPPHAVAYSSPVMTTRRSYQRSYEPRTYDATRSRAVRSDGTRVRTAGTTRSIDREDTPARSRSDAATTTTPARSRSDAATTTTPARSRSDAATTTTPTRSRSDATKPPAVTRSRSEVTAPPAISTPAPSSSPRSMTRSIAPTPSDRGNTAPREHSAARERSATRERAASDDAPATSRGRAR